MTFDDIDEIHRMEMSVYDHPRDVPGIKFVESLVMNCPDLTLVARDESGEIVGTMYGGLVHGTKMTERKINGGHMPDGDTLCVFSESIRNDVRGNGIGKTIGCYYYDEWIVNGKNRTKRNQIKYFSTAVRERHINWLKELGFTLVGISEIKYGNEPWFDVLKHYPT
jgi:ribosomal protein S18 acetylase RimI-like enzyme